MSKSLRLRTTSSLVGGVIAGLTLIMSPAAAEENETGLTAAIAAGSPILEFRARYETANISGVDDADAFTLRTRLGWKTGTWNNLSAVIEFDDVRALSGDYNDAVPPAEPFAVIADPEVTELNILQVAWAPTSNFKATVGRQRIVLDNQRFVGAVGWRQDDQTFDALRLDGSFGGVSITYAYIDHVNRIFAEELDWESSSHILNASYTFGPALKLTGFAYLLDFDNAAGASNATYGVSGTGKTTLGPVNLSYAATYATQSDYGDNPTDYNADYFEIEATAAHGPFALRAGFESLEGSGPGESFSTPLATLHAFNGWADVFLATPTGGLEDAFVAASYAPHVDLSFLSNPKFTLAYHDFESENASTDLGDEIDFVATASITEHLSVLAKFADYDGPGAPADRTRTWFGFEYKL